MGLISSSWVVEKQKNIFCLWPSYIKSTNRREKALIGHETLDRERCTLCAIVIKYSAGISIGYILLLFILEILFYFILVKYDYALAKLRALEEAQDSQNESCNEDSRMPKPNRNVDYAYSSDEDVNNLPFVPNPKKFEKLMPVSKNTFPKQLESSLYQSCTSAPSRPSHSSHTTEDKEKPQCCCDRATDGIFSIRNYNH